MSYEDAPRIFKGVQRIIVDEIHALAESKRGDQLMLALSRIQAMSPNLRRVGLSATVENPEAIVRGLLQPAETPFRDRIPNAATGAQQYDLENGRIGSIIKLSGNRDEVQIHASSMAGNG